jgi:hypothetical protein
LCLTRPFLEMVLVHRGVAELSRKDAKKGEKNPQITVRSGVRQTDKPVAAKPAVLFVLDPNNHNLKSADHTLCLLSRSMNEQDRLAT